MARLVVQAERQATTGSVVLVVSVVGAADGVPRTGLTVDAFRLLALTGAAEAAWEVRSPAQVQEGPEGLYTLTLGPDAPAIWPDSDMTVLALIVTGEVDTGWADDRGQTLVSGPPR
jgi:hypothetical protein